MPGKDQRDLKQQGSKSKGDAKSRDGRKQVKAGKGGKLNSDGSLHQESLGGDEEFPSALDKNDPNYDHGEDQETKPAPALAPAAEPATTDVDDIGDYFEQQSIFEAAKPAADPVIWPAKPANTVEELTGTWEVIDNGEMEEFMTAIGIGWMKRKAALMVTSMTTQTYKIKVDLAAKTVSIDNGKSENVVQCDGSEFTYKSTQGDALTTASLAAGKFVMTHQGTEESNGGMVTSRFVENGQLIQQVHHVKTDTTWRRVCKRVVTEE